MKKWNCRTTALSGISFLALGAMVHPAAAGCSSSGATQTSCDANSIVFVPSPGSSSLTISGINSVGVFYSPPSNTASGTYTESLTITGNTTLSSAAGQTNVNGGAGISMGATQSDHNDGVTLNSSVTVMSGSTITSHAQYGGGVFLRDEGTGTLSINNAGTVTVLGVDGTNTAVSDATVIALGRNASTYADGLSAVTSQGAATVVNSGVVTAYSGRGLYSEGSAATVSADNTATGVVNAFLGGIRVINYNGLALISNEGTVRSTDRQALMSWSSAGDASVSNTGTVTADDRNAIVASTENGNATITNSGTVTANKLSVNSQGASAGYSALRATADYTGNIVINNSGSVQAPSDAAIVGHTPQGNITIVNRGTLNGPNGIFADSGKGSGTVDTISDTSATSATTNGVIAVTNSGAITTSGVAVYLDGTTNRLTNSSTINATVATAVITGSGAGTIVNSGSINGHGGAITGALGTLTNSGVIAGNIVNNGSTTLTINGGESYGLLTGYNGGVASLSAPGTVGSLSNTASDLTFASGNIWLNDNIDATGHTVSVTNATVKVSAPITIAGNYSQTGGNLVETNISGLTITGSNSATVTNTAITISATNLRVGDTYTIVDANTTGTYTNDIARVRGTSGLTATLSTADNGHDLIATFSAVNYTGKGQSAGGAATGIGSALDAITTNTSPQAVAFQNTVLYPLSDLPVAAQQAAIKQLAPTQITPASQAATQAAAPTTSVIEQHELALLDGGNAGAAAGSAGHAFGVWGQMLGGTALRDSTANASGYRSKNFGLVSGLDYQPDPDTTLGVALSWVKGWSWGADTATGSYTTTNSYQITGYGLHRWGPVFLDGQLGFGYNTYDQTRAIGFLDQKAKASYGGEQYLVKSGIGYDFALGDGVTATPLAGLRFLRAVSDGYQESGSDSNLSVDRRGVQSLTQDLGGKVSWKLDTDWGLLTPEVRLAWVHDYTKGPIASSGLMGGQAFTSTVARPSADGAKLNLAATLDTVGDVSFRAEYEGEFRPDYQSHSGLIKATWGF